MNCISKNKCTKRRFKSALEMLESNWRTKLIGIPVSERSKHQQPLTLELKKGNTSNRCVNDIFYKM